MIQWTGFNVESEEKSNFVARLLEQDEDDKGNHNLMSPTMRIVFVVASMVCGLISFLCCIVVMTESLADLRRPNNSRRVRATSSRAVPFMHLALATAGAVWALMWATGPLPGPKNLDPAHYEGYRTFGHYGNDITCALQGFFKVYCLGVASILNAAIIAFYLLMVRYSWTEESLFRSALWVNAFAWTGMLGLSVPPAVYGIFGFNGRTCYIFTPSSLYCTTINATSMVTGEEAGEEDCSRGDLTTKWVSISSTVPHVFCILAVIACFLVIYCYVRVQEDRIYNRYIESTKNAVQYLSRHLSAPFRHDKSSQNTETTENCRWTERKDDILPPQPVEEQVEDNLEQEVEAEQFQSSERQEHVEEKQECDEEEQKHDEDDKPKEMPNVQMPPDNKPWDGYSIDRTKSKAVAHQGIFHSALFLAVAASEVMALLSNWQIVLWLLSQIIKGLQGLWLLAIVCRPRHEMKTKAGIVVRRYLMQMRCVPRKEQLRG